MNESLSKAARVFCAGISLSLCCGSPCSAQAAGVATKVFRCENAGQITFTDQPCASGEQSAEVAVPSSNTFHAEYRVARAVKSPRPSDDSIALVQLRHKETCRQLADQLRDIRSRLESKHKLRQEEHLRDRQRKFEQQQKFERCS